jgi:hypothetical protein
VLGTSVGPAGWTRLGCFLACRALLPGSNLAAGNLGEVITVRASDRAVQQAHFAQAQQSGYGKGLIPPC